MSKNWNSATIIGLGLNFTYEFEVSSKFLDTSIHSTPFPYSWWLTQVTYRKTGNFVSLCKLV